MSDVLPAATLILIRSLKRADYEVCSDLVSDSLFLDESQRIAWRAIDGFFRDDPTGRSDLSWNALQQLIPASQRDFLSNLKKASEGVEDGPLERRIVHQALRHSTALKLAQTTTDYVMASAEKKEDRYAKIKDIVEQAYMLEERLLDDDRVEPIRAKKATGFDTFNGPRIPFGISPRLDAATRGGYPVGKLGGVMAPLSVGKTLTLCNLGSMALRAGYPVYHFSLEMDQGEILAWYYSQLTGVKYKDLEANQDEILGSWKEEWGELLIYDYSGHRCTVNTIERAIKDIRRHTNQPGVLLLDYLALCDTPGDGDNRYFSLGVAVRQLRKMMVKYELAGITAVQANRYAMKDGRTQMHHIADCVQIGQVVDWMLALSQDETMKLSKQIHAAFIRSRLGYGNPQVTLYADYDRLRVFENEHAEVWEEQNGS